MSWELMGTMECGCKSYMDDWNRHKEEKCDFHIQEKIQKRKKRDLEVSKKENRCLKCVSLDQYGKFNDAPYFFNGFCGDCKEEKRIQLKNKYDLKSLEDISEIQRNIIIQKLYKKEFPKSRGFDTIKFEKWAKKLLRV